MQTMNELTKRIDDLVEDCDRARTLEAQEILLSALSKSPESPELVQAASAVARSLYETAETHEEGVNAIRFALARTGPKAAAELLEDLDGADAVQRVHLALIAEEADGDFAALYPALSNDAPLRRRLDRELKRLR